MYVDCFLQAHRHHRWGVERGKINRMRKRVIQAIAYMVGWGMSDPSVTKEIACANLLFRALRGTEPIKDCHRPQDQQEPCFQDEKAPR